MLRLASRAGIQGSITALVVKEGGEAERSRRWRRSKGGIFEIYRPARPRQGAARLACPNKRPDRVI